MGNNSYITYSNMKDRVYMIDIYHRAAIVVARYPGMSPLSVVDEFMREHERSGQRVHRKFSREFADKRVRKLAPIYRKMVGLIERL